MLREEQNIDPKTVESFGQEWSRFDQSEMGKDEAQKVFEEYFAVFPWGALPAKAEGFDMGCGSGRWARFVAPRVGKLNCVDPSAAIYVAQRALKNFQNIAFFKESVGSTDLQPDSQDFGYSLGVLHHVPNTVEAIRSCVKLLKPGAPLLLYLYYALDNRPIWFRSLWLCSEIGRRFVSRLPSNLKNLVTDAIAILVYWPLARLCRCLERCGFLVHGIPLSYYRHHSFYTMRTDARDRLGTPLERRFSRFQIEQMMLESGLSNIKFSEKAPYWCAVGFKK